MRYLIAGFGSIGRRHFRNLLELGERDIHLLRSHKSTLPEDEIAGFPVHTELEAALAHKPDAVIVCNPTALHLPVALAAAQQGCHLFIEKPVSHSHYGTQELLSAVKANDVTAAVGFQFRYHPGIQKAREIIHSGKLGEIISADASWGEYMPGWHPWEDYRLGYAAREDLGGGVVRTLCHPLDYLTWIFGKISSVCASVISTEVLDIEVDDVAEIDFFFACNTLAHVHLDYHRQPGSHTLSVTGTKGTLTWDYADGITRYFTIDAIDWQEILTPPNFERNNLFVSEMQNFINSIKGIDKPVCSLEDGIYNMQLVDTIYQSSRSGKRLNMQEEVA